MTTWKQHVERWRNCQLCDLCQQRSNIVLARGKIPCAVLLVGEAPGESEDALGQPFMGPAGKLLDQILETALQGKHRLAWTNLVACYPKEAKDAGTNEPSRKEIEACAPRLEEFIQLADPRLVVAVGTLAQRWLPEHGRHQCSVAHPAHVLRMPLAQQDFAYQKCVVTIRCAAQKMFEEIPKIPV